MSNPYESSGNSDITSLRSTAVAGGAFEDGDNSTNSASFSLHSFYPDRNRLYERNAPDDRHAHDSAANDIPGFLRQDVEATRDEEHKRKCAEKNALIEALKFEVEKTRHEDLQLQADTRQGEEKLARMKAELKRLQPQQEKEQLMEFYMRPAKVKKGKKK